MFSCQGQMKRCLGSVQLVGLAALVLLLMIDIDSTEAAKGGGGGRGRGRGGRGRMFGSRMPILIPNRNPGAVNYYENKDVSLSWSFFLW